MPQYVLLSPFMCFKASPPVEPAVCAMCTRERNASLPKLMLSVFYQERKQRVREKLCRKAPARNLLFPPLLSPSFEIHEDEVQLLFPISEMSLNTLLPKAS